MLGEIFAITKDGLKSIYEVTENDEVLVSDGYHIYFERPEITEKHIVEYVPISRNIVWHGSETDVVIPTYDTNRRITNIHIDLMPWIRFLGLWTIDGSVSIGVDKKPRKVVISTRLDIDDVMQELPFKYSKYVGNVTRYEIYNTQLAMYLSKFGKKKDRTIPDAIHDLPPEHLSEFVKWIYYGAGKDRRITTTSHKLISSLIEIFVKLGKCVHVNKWSSGVYVLNECCHEPYVIVEMVNWKTELPYVYLISSGYGWWFKYES